MTPGAADPLLAPLGDLARVAAVAADTTDRVSPGGLRHGPQPCSTCGSDRFRTLFEAWDRQFARREDWVYGRCEACGLVSLRPLPREPELASYYPRDYAPHAPPSAPDRGDARRPGALERFAVRHRFGTDASRRTDAWGRVGRGLSRWLARGLIEPRGSNRLLDVGCGSGRVLERHRALGWEVRGIDPGARAVEACHARGLPVQQAGLLEADLPSRHFDVILLHHVIEHVPRPLDALRRARELLAPSGEVHVVTPNVGGLGFRLYGSCWYALDAPRHLHLFDRGSLSRVCESAGLSVASMTSEPSARILASSRHYQRSQGATLPPGLAARSAALERSRGRGDGGRGFRRAIRPVTRVAAWLGGGEILRATLVDPGRRR